MAAALKPNGLIRVRCLPGEWQVAVLVSGVLREFALWRPGSPDGYGDLHVGRVSAVVPALAGAFVALEGGEGFLPDRGEVSAGQMVLVRIIRAAQGDKGPRLARVIEGSTPDTLAGAPRRLAPGPSPLHECATRYADAPIETDDLHLVPAWRRLFGERVRHMDWALSPLDDEIAGLAEPSVACEGGARLYIEPTRALTAIDIDAGGATASRRPKAAAQAELNRLILPEVARQICLRNLAGAIVIDLAGMPARRRADLAPLLAEALAADPLQPRLLGFSALGFAEISRPRQRPPLHELLATPLAAGLAGLGEVLRRPADQKLCLRAAPAVIAALEADGQGLADLARRGVHRLILRNDPGLPGNRWALEEVR